jgi:hypothetical protein
MGGGSRFESLIRLLKTFPPQNGERNLPSEPFTKFRRKGI